ncbi:MAG: PAC2 family protein [Candidatus Hadarchaeota archaeon]
MPINLNYLGKPKLKNPAMVAGLPGIANVGKVAAEFLIHDLGAQKFLELTSEHFPEWALPDKGGIRAMKMEFFHTRPEGTKNDLVIMTADAQAATPKGQYMLTEEILGLAEEHGIKTVATMAAYVISPEETRKKSVLGAASNQKIVELLRKKGVEILTNGMIVGMNGMLPGFAALRGMDGFCLLSVTDGGIVDPKASAEVVQAMASIFDFKVDTSDLEMHAAVASKMKPPEIRAPDVEEELSYIR